MRISWNHVSQYKISILVVLMFLLTSCVGQNQLTPQNAYYVSREFNALGQNERIRFLIMHYTALDDEHSLNVLTQEQVSAHYLIPKKMEIKNNKPILFQLVDESKRAYHAGVSNWNNRTSINDTSIGIEIVNRGYTENMLEPKVTWYPYSEQQINAVAALAKDIINRYRISADNVLGHSDVAPLRKQDPGILFPWEKLAKKGVGAWPDKYMVKKYLANRDPYESSDTEQMQILLKKYGYGDTPQTGILDANTRKIISAFQMHFRPQNIDGNPDAETEAIAKALVVKYR